MSTLQQARATAFVALHAGAGPLVLPNAWDAASARVFVPGGLERDTIRALVEGLDGPLNILANPATASPVVPSVAVLAELGAAATGKAL